MAIRALNASVLSIGLAAVASTAVGVLVGRYSAFGAEPRAPPSASTATASFDRIGARLGRLEEQLATSEANQAQALQALAAEIRSRSLPGNPAPPPPSESHMQPRDEPEAAAANAQAKVTLDRIETLLAQSIAKKRLDRDEMTEFRTLFGHLPAQQRLEQKQRLIGLINTQQISLAADAIPPFF
jgi:hypothetical protein